MKWAHVILDNWTSLQQEMDTLRSASGALSGRLSIGVIPSGLPMAGLIGKALREHHPDVELTILSQSSIEILRNLEDFAIDVGLTYLDNGRLKGCAPKRSIWSATASWCVPIIGWRGRPRSRGPRRPESCSAC